MTDAAPSLSIHSSQVMDVDKSGEITVDEIVNLVFHKAHKQERTRIRIAIDEEIKRRVNAADRHKNMKPKFRRISTVELSNASQLFDYFDEGMKGEIVVKEVVKLMMKEETFRHCIKVEDIEGMLGSFAVNGCVDLDSWIQFTYGFKGPFEIFDFRNGKVIERRNDPHEAL